jgi:hypothetical protein
MGPLRPPVAPVKRKPRRWKRTAIPEDLRREVVEFGQRLEADYRSLFTRNPQLKRCLAKLLEFGRRPGRPGFPAVTKAQRLFTEIRGMYPTESPRALWRRVYPAAIENYESLGKLEKQAARQELRSRVRWRQRARKRRGSRPLGRSATG